MNIPAIQKKFNTQNRCIKHLEKVRWDGEPICPHCKSSKITPRINRKHFYHCNHCNRDFTVMFDTIFEGSKMPLPKWFLLIAMMLNARKGISAKELSRQLGVTYKTSWYSAMRVRCAMIDEGPLLEGIVEMDEAYVGGKPRKGNVQGSEPANEANLSALTLSPSKRGRGTKKVPVVGIVEREGQKRVVTEVTDQLTTKNMLHLLKKYVNLEKSIMMTDEARFYDRFDTVIQHLVIKHKERYADGPIHTNTIEGFWAIVKRGIEGEFHALSRKYLPFYLAEFAYKYNRRNKKELTFDETIDNAVADENCFVNYKPKGNVRKIAYGETIRKKASAKQKPAGKSNLKKTLQSIRKRKCKASTYKMAKDKVK